MSSLATSTALTNAQLVPIPPGEKAPRCKGWPNIRLSQDDLQRHLDRAGNVAVRLGPASGDLVDIDLDCSEASAIADLYLPPTGAEFGRPSKPRSHRLYTSPGATFAAFADPLNGAMLLELRSDGRDGGAHLTLLPPSVTDGERREWHGDVIEPAGVDAAVLARCAAWLAIGCLVMRHLSPYAARRPHDDLADLLWEADPALGRAAYGWLGRPAPDEPQQHPKPRGLMSHDELRLAELVAAIPNNLNWTSWNRLGMAIYAASGGSGEGFVAFDDLSARSPKYQPHSVRERWNNYRRSPPSRITVGTLVYLARQHGWHRSAA